MSSKSVLFVIGSLKKGGAERNLVWLANRMSKDGYQVDIILYKPIIEFDIHPEIKVTSIRGLEKTNSLNKLLRIYFGIFKKIWSLKPTVSISFTRLSGQFLALTCYPNVIVRYDSFPFMLKKRRLRSSVFCFNFFNVKRVVCQSIELQDRLKPYFISKNKLRVIYNPVNQPVNVEGENSHAKPYFLFVGRLSWIKQLEHLIEAYNTSQSSNDYDLIIVGEGPELKKLKDHVDQIGIQNKVHFQGYLSQPRSLMSNARALVLSSSFEGFPNVLVESLSEGTPVISSDCSTGPKEIIENRVNGLLYPVGNTPSLSQCFDTFAFDEELYTFCKKNATGSVERFNDEKVYEDWLNVIN